MAVGQLQRSSHTRLYRRRYVFVWGTLCLAVHGCSAVNGGAVELSWKLRSASGGLQDFLDCTNVFGTNPSNQITLEVKQIRLQWEVGFVTDHRDFDCTTYHGVTGFELPPGQALLSVSPICVNGPAAAGTYIAPAPEQRTVIVGNTINLEAVELILEVPTTVDPTCDVQPCICQ